MLKTKQRNYAFDLSDRSHITVRGLNLFANTITTSDSSQGIIIDGIRAKYVSQPHDFTSSTQVGTSP